MPACSSSVALDLLLLSMMSVNRCLKSSSWVPLQASVTETKLIESMVMFLTMVKMLIIRTMLLLMMVVLLMLRTTMATLVFVIQLQSNDYS